MRAIIGLILLAAGGYLVLAGFSVIPLFSKALVPLWIIAGFGCFVALMGVLFLLSGGGGGAQSRMSGSDLVIEPNERPRALLMQWIYVLTLFALVIPFWGAMFSDAPSSGPEWVGWFVLGLFTLIGLAMLYSVAQASLSARRFGHVALQLSGGQPHIGGTLAGRLDVPAVGRFRKVETELICYCVSYQSSVDGKGVRVEETEAWKAARQVQPVRGGAGGLRLDVQFAIPGDLPETTVPGEGVHQIALGVDYYRWELRVTGDISGVDLVRSFPIAMQRALPGAAPSAAADADTRGPGAGHAIYAVRTVAAAELAAGRSAAQVVQKLRSLGIATQDIITALDGLQKDRAVPGADLLRQQVAELRRVQAEMDSGQLMMLSRPTAPGGKSGG